MLSLDIGLIAAMSCILFLSLFGNIILCVVVRSQLPQQAVRNYSYLILNLAVCDILFASSSIPFNIVERLKSPRFPFAAAMCRLLWPFQTVCCMASIFTVGALSYQRYRLVVRPFTGKLRQRRFFIMLISIWLLPVFLAGLPYSFVLRFDENTTTCFEEWIPGMQQVKMKLIFTTYLFIIQFVLPLSLIVWCNVKAIVKLKRYLKYRKRTSMISALSIEHHENTVKMLTAIMAVFALFWLPGQVMHFLLEFEGENEFIINYGLDIGYLFVFTNCVMNPLIFAYFTKCHKNWPRRLRRLTSSTIDATIACELGQSTLRRESEPCARDSLQRRRDSLPGNMRRVPLARTLKRPSLPALLQREDITNSQRKNIQAKRGNSITSIRNSHLSKIKLPVLSEMTSDLVPAQTQEAALPSKTQNLDVPTDSALKRNSLSGSRKRLSFSIPTDPHSSPQNNDEPVSNLQNDAQTKTELNEAVKESQSSQKHSHDEKRPSFSILKKRDPIWEIQAEKNGEIDAENKQMRNFLEIIRTMKEDVLRKYLDSTPETELN